MTAAAIEATSPKATSREWIGLAVLALPCLLYSMDLTVLHLAIPMLSADLKPSSAELLWIIDIYGFMVAGWLITMGTLGDRIGRRKILFIGAAAFAVASVLAAFSTTSAQLIAARAVLGVAGATVAPSTLSLLRNMFVDARQRTTAIAVWVTAYSIGGVIGPLVGGIVLEFFWWGAVFLIAVPVMALLLAVGPFLLPEYRDPNAGRPDVASAMLSLGAVLSAIFGLKLIAQDGLGAVPVLAILAGIALGVAFVRRQLSLHDPLLDLTLFRARGFTASLATYGIGLLVVFGGFLFIPQYLQLVLGLSPLEAGLWTVPWGLAFVGGSMITPRLVRMARPAYVMSGGLLVASLGLLAFSRFDANTGLVPFIFGSVAFAVGLSPMVILTTDLIIGSAPQEKAGAASGISETSAEFGGALGIAVFGSIGVAIYRAAMADVEIAVPAEAAGAARDTLGGAIAVAAELPEQVGNALVAAARDAFIRGMQLTAAISTAGTAALAVFVAVALRRERGSGGSE